MKKLPLIFILSVIVCFKINAQEDKKISDLIFLNAEEKYEKLVSKSTSLTLSDSYKKHPTPYLYVAIGYLEMAKRPGQYDVGEKDSKYKNPLKSAQKYLAKYLKVELKAAKYFPDYEANPDDYKEIAHQVADSSNKLGQNYYSLENPRKAASVYKYASKAVPHDPVLLLWQGISEIKSKNTLEGDKNVIAALNKIDKDYQPERATSGVISQGMLILEEYLTQKGDATNASKAKEMVVAFRKYDLKEQDRIKREERKAKKASEKKVTRKFYSDKEKDGKVVRKNGKIKVEDNDASINAEDELDKLEREAKED